MLLTFVLFYLTYIQATYSLPPLPTNLYRNNLGSNFNNRYSESFLLDKTAIPEVNENARIRGLRYLNNQPTIKNIPKINPAQGAIQNNEAATTSVVEKEDMLLRKPNVNQIVNNPQIYGNQNLQQKLSQIQQDINVPQQYSLPHNFKINLRGYLAPEINNGLIPPKADLPKLFLTTHVTPVQNIMQPSNLMIAETRNFEITNNRPIRNRPIIPVPEVKRENIRFPRVRDLSSRATKESYTIVHPNGEIEESNDFEYIKKNFPHYIVHDLSEQNIKKDDRIVNAEVHAGTPIPNPTIVPIYNIRPTEPLPINSQKETITPYTLVGKPKPELAKLSEPVEINSSYVNDATISSLSTIFFSKNLTSTNILSKPASSTNSEAENLPLIDNTTIQPSKIVHAPDNGPLVLNQDESDSKHNLDQDNNNAMFEKISANEFWKDIPEIKQILDSSAESVSYIKEENTENTTNKDFNPEINTEYQSPKKITNEDDEPNEKNADGKYEIFNVNPEIIDDFLTSIDERIEFIESFLIIKETEHKETNIKDDLTEDLNNTANMNTDVTNNSKSQDNQDIIEPIDIPHISLLQDDDTNSTFWFTTKDEKALDKLARESQKSESIASPTLTIENDKTITIYPNGTTVENTVKTITEEKQSPLITKSTKITHPNGEVEIKER